MSLLKKENRNPNNKIQSKTQYLGYQKKIRNAEADRKAYAEETTALIKK